MPGPLRQLKQVQRLGWENFFRDERWQSDFVDRTYSLDQREVGGQAPQLLPGMDGQCLM